MQRALLFAGVALALAGAATIRPPRAAPALVQVMASTEPVPRPSHRAARPHAHRSHPRRERRHRAPPERVDLNHAGAATLERALGISANLARRIVAFRALNGPFESLDELSDVAGMTERRVDALAARLVLH